ncbi:leucine-rich repeat-containing protein 70 [Teleopsis dalmanni]|uniref:leucine-rich repeat-containing protein 70-like n=1 Tax=Teleopsis dalmanni TaxID=139649 RepID=UPI0018CC9AE6|nr:leucine-rich repeat-containing protein 70-like [Teleopsis dalmanni]XP_037955731.1 leucine-rich repeat-containing protein 70 [Teleopsis dalmanni]
MDYKILLLLSLVHFGTLLCQVKAQHENIPYQSVTNICKTCECLTAQDANKHYHYVLNCAVKKFEHILARWPPEFGNNHNGIDIVATYSGNYIDILQQLPATNSSLSFTCRHCSIKHLQVPTFMDVPYLKRLDISWNEITSYELTPDVFRGPYRATRYEPIALTDLDLSNNKLHTLDRKLFEHTPNLTKLNLSNNKFGVLDVPTTVALAMTPSLEILDLSYTGIETLTDEMFKPLVNLKSLNLAGNKLTVVPAGFKFIGQSLEILNLAENSLKGLTEQNFVGLKVLKRLNVSDTKSLVAIEKHTFSRLETLEYLYCSHNPKLEYFDLDSLLHCNNLTYLDISHCNISTLTIGMDLSKTTTLNGTNLTLPQPWPKLQVFETTGNPWLCDCELFQLLEFAGSHHQRKEAETRCDSPYLLAGARFSNLTAEQVCSMQIPKKYHVVDEDPPRFLRKRYIILTAIIASVVLILGLMIGFVVSCIRRRLKRDDFGVEPIRYTSVRSSNLSAFSHVNSNGNTNNA